MGIQLCESCAAPLPLAPPGTIVNCKHCDVDNFIKKKSEKKKTDDLHSGLQQVFRSLENNSFQKSKKTILFTLSLFVLTPFVLGIFFILLADNSLNYDNNTGINFSKEIINKIGETTNKNKSLSAYDLPELDKLKGYHKIDVQDIPGSLSDLNATVAIPWLLMLAKHWSPDVNAYYIKLKNYPAFGEYNLAEDKKAELRADFISPAKFEAAKKMLEVSEEKIPWMLRLEISHEGITAAALSPTTSGYHPTDKVLPDNFCSLEEVLKIMKEEGLLPRPKYSISLRHLKGHWGWRAGINLKFSGAVSANNCVVQ